MTTPPTTLDPIHPSAATRETYDRRLAVMIDRMSRDVSRTVLAEYRANPPEHMVVYGMDASPAKIVEAAMRRLARTWQRRFDDFAPKLAKYFATDVRERCDRTLRRQLRTARISVRFRPTRAMNDAYQAVLAENVSLIKSIPEQYMTGVQTLVLQSVQAGRDLGTLAQGLEKRHGVTRRRAAFIARDQNNRATAIMTRTRYLEAGITRAKWLHSAGGKTPRPEHVTFSGRTYDVAKGHDFDNGEGLVWPGTAINCRCVPVPVLPGFDE